MDLQGIKNKIFLDDTRLPPNNDWIVVRNISQFLEVLSTTKEPFVVSFDYDLGNQILPDIVEITYYNGEISNYCLSVFNENEKNGLDCATAMIGLGKIPEYCFIHSENREGRKLMKEFLENNSIKVW